MKQPEPSYKLLDWIDLNIIDWDCLSANTNAIPILEKKTDKIDSIYTYLKYYKTYHIQILCTHRK